MIVLLYCTFRKKYTENVHANASREAGPFRLQKDSDTGQMTLNEIDGAWNEYANVLFGKSFLREKKKDQTIHLKRKMASPVDQPAGTGYSFVSTNHYVHDLEIAADHIVEFLRQFYQIFPEYSEMDVSHLIARFYSNARHKAYDSSRHI